MKIRFFPKKDTVLALLQLKIDDVSTELARAEADYERRKKFLPEANNVAAEWSQKQLSALTDLRSLLESHAYPHVTAETEL